VAYIGMTDKLVNYPIADENHMKHHKTLRMLPSSSCFRGV